MPSLSPRLQQIYKQLLTGEAVWDLCCDHGYVGSHAYQSQLFPEINFVDQVPEIIVRLEERFQRDIVQTTNPTATRFITASGEELTLELTGNVVISGVGSYTIFQILKSLQTKNLLKAKRLILCPQNDVVKMDEIKKLPGFLYRQSQDIISVNEKDRVREIFVLDQVTHT
ncbi:SAM-dependent methyltransferase [Pseudobdellovibrio sp. HCB154]|uniref:SAM-dependent methyltransferase n=1 Tax=Pseudobdellovibrio sp. HCB154 TaxID=3386277 RepID=UPI003916EA6D